MRLIANRKVLNTLICLTLLYTTWGMVYLSIKFALESFPPVMLSGMRYLVAGSCILAWMYIVKGVRTKPTKHDIKVMTISSLGMIVISGSFLNISEKYISSGEVALILASTPIWMVLTSWLAGYDKRPSLSVAVGLAGGFVGVVLLSMSIGLGKEGSLAGVLFILISMGGWVIGSLYARAHHASLQIFHSLGFQMLIGGVIMLTTSYVTGEMDTFKIEAVTLKSFLSYLHLVFFGSIVGFSCYMWLLYNTPTPIAVSYAYAEPVIAVLLGAMFAGEHIYKSTAAACFLIVVSVFFVMRTKKEVKIT